VSTVEETVAWEAEQRPRAGYASLAAALLTVAGSTVTTVAIGGLPDGEDTALTSVDVLGRVAAGEDAPPGRLAEQTNFLADHATGPIVGTLLFGLGTLLIFLPLALLFRATRARRPATGQIALVLAAVGTVGFAVGRSVAELSRYFGALDFRDSADQTNSSAADALTGTVYLLGNVVWQAGALAMGFAFVLIALNAMRVGLLTRFMGILGVIVGITFVLPLDQQGIIRVFWLGALGALLLGRWPNGVPKAWQTGEAEPWPSAQQARAEREAARTSGGGGGGSAPRPAPRREAPAARPPTPRRPEPMSPQAHAASKKKRRKRRT